MDDFGRIMRVAADAGFAPAGIRIPPLARREDEINFFRRMGVVGVSHVWSDKAQTEDKILALLKTGWPDDLGVGMIFGEVCFRIGRGRPPVPGKMRVKSFKCGDHGPASCVLAGAVEGCCKVPANGELMRR